MAAFSLPFVHLGLAKDFWNLFDRYVDLEEGLNSTFFVIPKKGDPGRNADGAASARRAARYGIADIADQVQRLISARREIALHGIDAWHDVGKGRTELETIQHLTGESEIGVRMHWLFFDQNSLDKLEEAGFSYDSTVGYNETVGYRAGTTQAFKPLGAARMLELPMHIMDTALFYPAYMNLSPRQGEGVGGMRRPLQDHAAAAGEHHPRRAHHRRPATDHQRVDEQQQRHQRRRAAPANLC